MKKIIPVVGCVAARAAARPVEPQPPRQAGVLLSPIHLSIPTSRGDAKSTADAAKLLIHESVHHLGVQDDDFANRVALNTYELHKSKIPPTLALECNLSDQIT